MGYGKKVTCTNYFIIFEKKDFQESTPKNQMLMLGLPQSSHFGLWDIIPLRVPASFSHILCKIWEHVQPRAKELVGTRGGGMMF